MALFYCWQIPAKVCPSPGQFVSPNITGEAKAFVEGQGYTWGSLEGILCELLNV